MEIILTAANAHPRKGIISSERFSTKTSGGKMACRPIVSQADWCLERMTDGVAGMFSRPMT